MQTGHNSLFWKTHKNYIQFLLLSCDQKLLLSGCNDGELKQHSVVSGFCIENYGNLGMGALTTGDNRGDLVVIVGEKNQFMIIDISKNYFSAVQNPNLPIKFLKSAHFVDTREEGESGEKRVFVMFSGINSQRICFVDVSDNFDTHAIVGKGIRFWLWLLKTIHGY